MNSHLPGKHRAAFPPGTDRGARKTRLPPPPQHTPRSPRPGTAPRLAPRGREDESRSQPFFIPCNRPQKEFGPR